MLLKKNQEATESKGLKRNKKTHENQYSRDSLIKRRKGHLHANGGKHNLPCSVTLAR